MKGLLLRFVILLNINVGAQSDTVFWGKTVLKINDFVGLPDTVNKKDIAGYSALNSNVSWRIKKDTIYLTAANFFLKKESFFKKSKKGDSVSDKKLLDHEQRHFDLQEIE